MARAVVMCFLLAGLTLSGCANMTPQQQSIGTGAGAGAALGALVGGLAGGGKGAWIGAASGALIGGLAGYALAPDPLTQSAAQTANEWQQTMGAQPETKAIPVTMPNGQTVNQIDEMTLKVPSSKMEAGGHLSKDGAMALRKMIANTKQNGGSVRIYYPPKAPRPVVQSLTDMGVSIQKAQTGSEYVFVVKRLPGNNV